MNQERAVFGGLAVTLLLTFFMPWLVLDLMFVKQSVSGAALPGQLRSLIGMADSLNTAFGGRSSGAGLWGLLLYALYLIPLGGGLVAFRAFVKGTRGRELRGAALGAGVVSLVLSVLTLTAVLQGLGREALSFLAGGFWLTLLAAAGLVVAVGFLPAREGPGSLVTHEQRTHLRARSQQTAGQVTEWLQQRRQQVEAGVEQARVRQALGRRLDRTILDAHDAVLAPAGTLITHDLVERARKAGLLGMLLSSVERPQVPSGDVQS